MMHSTKENSESLSLNGCLKTGPALGPAKEHPDQKKIKSIALCGNLQKAFPQIQIKKVPVCPKRRSQLNRTTPIYKTFVWLSSNSLPIIRNNR